MLVGGSGAAVLVGSIPAGVSVGSGSILGSMPSSAGVAVGPGVGVKVAVDSAVLVGVLVGWARAVAVALGVAVTSGVGVAVGAVYDQSSVPWHLEHWPRGCPLGREWQELQLVYVSWSNVTSLQLLVLWQLEH